MTPRRLLSLVGVLGASVLVAGMAVASMGQGQGQRRAGHGDGMGPGCQQQEMPACEDPIPDEIQTMLLERFGDDGIDADADGTLTCEEINAFFEAARESEGTTETTAATQTESNTTSKVSSEALRATSVTATKTEDVKK